MAPEADVLAAARRAWSATDLGPMGPHGARVTAGGQLHPVGEATLFHDARFADDLERIRESPELARLAGVGQVFAGPGRGHCSRLEHAHDVAALAGYVAGELSLRIELAESIALAHDCGHPPFAHVGEATIRRWWPDFSHASYAAWDVLPPLGLSHEVIEGVRLHSWAAGAAKSAEAEVVRWVDRIAYLTRDLEDARLFGISGIGDLPRAVTDELGTHSPDQRAALLAGLVDTSKRVGVICMSDGHARALAALRRHNMEGFYASPPILEFSRSASEVLALALGRVSRSRGLPLDGRSLGLASVAEVLRMDDRTVLSYGASASANPPVAMVA